LTAGCCCAALASLRDEGYEYLSGIELEFYIVTSNETTLAAQDAGFTPPPPPVSAFEELVPEALRRANAYFEVGVDCVYPIALWETDALRRFTSEVSGPVNVVRLPQTPSLAELAAVGVARVSWGPFLHLDAMARFKEQLASLQE
jgi:2-methylisocitrate lyase-like PEP mutase family enzyme